MTLGELFCARGAAIKAGFSGSINPHSAFRRGAMNYDVTSIAGRVVAVVLAGFRKSSLAGGALRVRRVDRRDLAEAGEDASNCLADGFCEIPFAVGSVVPAGAGIGLEFFVACADGSDRRD